MTCTVLKLHGIILFDLRGKVESRIEKAMHSMILARSRPGKKKAHLQRLAEKRVRGAEDHEPVHEHLAVGSLRVRRVADEALEGLS